MKLRIISGELKGRRVKVPHSKLIRPTTDMVRESLFNILAGKINLDGTKVLDLYAGSGALGFECISRGAGEVHFVEKNYNIYINLINNINQLGIEDKCKIFKMSTLQFTKKFENCGYDLVLADPPFFKDDIYKVVENLKINKYIKKEGFIVIERSIQTREKDTENFQIQPFKIMGDTCLYEIRN